MLSNVYDRFNFSRLMPGSVCGMCRGPGAGDTYCRACITDLPCLGTACTHCALPLPVATVCPGCQLHPPPFRCCLAMFRYDYPLNCLVQHMKFKDRPSLAHTLGDLMLPLVRERSVPLPDALIPMPLHWRRTLARGYNQALELARPLAAGLDRPVLDGLCKRIRATRPQTRLTGLSRQDNVDEAFAVRRPVPAHVAIVDDVLTTGHTATALSLCLLEGGAKRVDVWVLARAGVAG